VIIEVDKVNKVKDVLCENTMEQKHRYQI